MLLQSLTVKQNIYIQVIGHDEMQQNKNNNHSFGLVILCEILFVNDCWSVQGSVSAKF